MFGVQDGVHILPRHEPRDFSARYGVQSGKIHVSAQLISFAVLRSSLFAD